MKKHFQILLPIFLGLITVLYFLPGFSSKYIFGEVDTLGVYLPNRDYVFSELKKGYIPLWCDELALGFPIIAEGHIAFFYPLNIICLFLPLALAVNIFSIFHYFLAGFFTYLFCKTIKLDNFSSFVAGLTFAFGGYLTGHSIHLNIITTVSWFPLILLFIEKGFKNSKYFIFAGIVMGVQTLGYFPQISLYTAIGIFLYSVVRGFIFKEYKLTGIFIILIIVFLFSSVQILPSWELTKNSVRSQGVSDFFRGTFSLSYLRYIFFPNYQRKIFNLSDCPYEFYLYIGIIPLIITFFSFFKKHRYKYLFYLLFLFPFFYSLKDIYKMFYFIPIFNLFAASSRFLFLSSFFLSVLCGIGFGFLNIKDKLKILIIILIIFDLYIFNIRENIFYTENFPEQTEIISFLKKDKTNWRIFTEGISSIVPNLNLYHRIPSINVFTPLMIERSWKFLNIFFEKGEVNVLNLLNVKYIITSREINNPAVQFVFEEKIKYIFTRKKLYHLGIQRISQSKDNIKIYKNKTNINTYAFVVHKHQRAKNKDEALKLLTDKNFNFRDTVIIEDNIKFKGKNKMFLNNRFSVFDRKGFRIFMNSPGYLVLSQSFYPGWNAYINGKEAKIYPANYALQAVYLTKGENIVDFVYEPLSFKIGWIVSIFSVIIVMVALIGFRKFNFCHFVYTLNY